MGEQNIFNSKTKERLTLYTHCKCYAGSVASPKARVRADVDQKEGENSVDTLCLKGTGAGGDHESRITFLTAMLNNAEVKMNHFDKLRQTNMNIALVIFAGMCGFAFQTALPSFRQFSFVALALVMVIFCLLDRRYHRFQHGWRRTRKQITLALTAGISQPQEDVTVDRYYPEGENRAEVFSLQPVLYYLLAAAALCLSVVFAFGGH